MLHRLSIQNILLIEQVDLVFGVGLNVLTGETGAGKSILLDALGFVLGWRGRAELVRSGAELGEVTAEFDLPDGHPAISVLQDAGLPFDGDLILRRTNSLDGRKRAFVNDRSCSAEVLRRLSAALVEIHGQHDDRGLLDPKGHRGLLDAFAENGAALAQTQNRYSALRKALKTLKTLQDDLEMASEDADFVAHAVAELETLDPQTGEDATLDSQRRQMQSAERIRADVEKGHAAILTAESMMIDGQRWLEDVSGAAEGRLDSAIDAIGRAMIEISEAQADVAGALSGLDFSPYDLEQVEERLFAIRALARKHDVQPDALPDLLQDFREKMTRMDTGNANLAGLEAEVTAAHAAYQVAAQTLSNRRHKAAVKLDIAMGHELTPLKMERAQFMTKVTGVTCAPSDPK
ncbi:MAG: AAA family ATPase [Rhodobacteraceae bacterium]|nr:AAA family ATPase [Paracoccaceae bacterium]